MSIIAPPPMDPQQVETIVLHCEQLSADKQYVEKINSDQLAQIRDLEEQYNLAIEERDNYKERLDLAYQRIDRMEAERDYQRRLRSNRHLNSSEKHVLDALREQKSQAQNDIRDLAPIRYGELTEATGLSHDAVSKALVRLEQWEAIARTDEWIPSERKGKKISKDIVSIGLNDLAIKNPEKIKPVLPTQKINRGGPRERCKRCKGTNLKRVHHVICLDCGEEHIDYAGDIFQKGLMSDLDRAIAENTHNTAKKQDAFYKSPEESPANEQGPATTIYVDEVVNHPDSPFKVKQFCSLATDGNIEDLHKFAEQLGMQRSWIVNPDTRPHYDIFESKRRKAVALGAQSVSAAELVKRCYERQETGTSGNTAKKHLAFYPPEPKEVNPKIHSDDHATAISALIPILEKYGVKFKPFLTCKCGCQLWREVLGEWECARCAPSPIWPNAYDQAIRVIWPDKRGTKHHGN